MISGTLEHVLHNSPMPVTILEDGTSLHPARNWPVHQFQESKSIHDLVATSRLYLPVLEKKSTVDLLVWHSHKPNAHKADKILEACQGSLIPWMSTILLRHHGRYTYKGSSLRQ